MTRIIAADILIADVIAPLEGHPQLDALVQKFHMEPGKKTTISEEGQKEFTEALSHVEVTVTPGGSSANMLTALSKLLGREVDIRFLGMTGSGPYGELMHEALADCAINLVPDYVPPGVILPAVSYVLVYPDGQCTIATFPGTAKEMFKPAMIAEHLVKNSDIVLVQGALWRKFHPEFADRLTKLAAKHKRELWLTLPTQSDLLAHESARFLEIAPQAALLFGNEAELERLYHTGRDDGLKKLQHIFRANQKDDAGPMAFITFGKDGAALVSAHGINYISPIAIDAADIINTLGAGDTSYAGFAAGYISKLPHTQSAQIAMILAGEKLRVNSSRLGDPKTTLNTVAPDLAHMLRNS